MPYTNREDLPDNVLSALQNVPHAQDIYKEAYNTAYEQYADPADRDGDSSREETAHAVAWNAVKQQYTKEDDGLWHPKDQS